MSRLSPRNCSVTENQGEKPTSSVVGEVTASESVETPADAEGEGEGGRRRPLVCRQKQDSSRRYRVWNGEMVDVQFCSIFFTDISRRDCCVLDFLRFRLGVSLIQCNSY